MAKIVISATRSDAEIQASIVKELGQAHEVHHLSAEPGREWRLSLKETLHDIDAVVVIVTEEYVYSNEHMGELNALFAYSQSNERVTLIPLLIGEIDPPRELTSAHYLSLDPRQPRAVELIIEKINSLLARAQGRLAAQDEKRDKIRQRLESTASKFVDQSLEELRARELKLEKQARFWYWIGFSAIVFGILAAGYLALMNVKNLQDIDTSVGIVALTILKSILVVGLLLAAARYGFSLAKAYMDEALKNADRIHAISFGKFYLEAYGDTAEPSDVKEVFQHWNTTRSNSFSTQSVSDVDVKTLEMAMQLTKSLVEKKK